MCYYLPTKKKVLINIGKSRKENFFFFWEEKKERKFIKDNCRFPICFVFKKRK